jgi:hypothetical protein
MRFGQVRRGGRTGDRLAEDIAEMANAVRMIPTHQPSRLVHGLPEHSCFTRSVGSEVATAEPAAFVAVTATPIVDPKSTGVSMYVAFVVSVAVKIGTHEFRLVSQRHHW